MTHYANGAKFERRIAVYLSRNGYWTHRSAGSRSLVDVVAIKPGEIILAQCKIGNARVNHDDWNALLELARSIRACPVVIVRTSDAGAFRMDEIIGEHAEHSHTWPSRSWSPDHGLDAGDLIASLGEP